MIDNSFQERPMTGITIVIEATIEGKDPYTVQRQRGVTQIALTLAGKACRARRWPGAA